MNNNFQKLLEFKTCNYGKDLQNISDKVYELSLTLLNHITREVEIFLTYNKTVQFEFDLDDKYLEIEVMENGFNIWGNNLDFFNYGDNGIYLEENKLYEVINHIKIFFNGKPNNSILFTGAFNPPTIAHQNVIESSLRRHKLNFDYVIIALSNQKFLDKKQSKIKDETNFAYSEQQRLDMMLEMTYENEKVLIFGIEQGYTYEVLTSVKNKYNIQTLYFAMGSDKLNEIQHWGYHDKLLKEFYFYILIRGNDDLDCVNEKCKNIFIDNNFVLHLAKDSKYQNISATQVRKCIKNNLDYSTLVNKNVKNYLKKMVEI